MKLLRVLVADDNSDAADTLAEILRGFGHFVEIARDGLIAVEMAIKMRPDLMFLDLGMPKLTGFEVARQLHSEEWRQSMTIVACSGYADIEHRKLSAEVGCNHHFAKPMEFEELRKFLDSIGACSTLTRRDTA